MIRRFLLVSISVLIVAVLSADEPEFDGKPLGYWLSQSRHKESHARIQAIEAIEAIGGNGELEISALIELLSDKEESSGDCRFGPAQHGADDQPSHPGIDRVASGYRPQRSRSCGLGVRIDGTGV